jgi:SAM-dependent methyltransferase
MRAMMDGSPPLPPEQLRFNVSNSRDVGEFLKVGKRCADELESGVSAVGGDLFSCGRVLDWGCGCGRTLRWMAERAKPHQFSGCDVDAAAIEWCQNNLRQMDFEVTEAHPSLPYQDRAFELVFGVSVFTHLNEDFQQCWLAELCRIIAPQGFLLLSVAGTNIANTLPEELKAQFHAQGFLFLPSPVWEGIHAEWYADAYQSEEFVRDRFSKYFEVLSYTSAGMNGHQDLVVMRKRP